MRMCKIWGFGSTLALLAVVLSAFLHTGVDAGGSASESSSPPNPDGDGVPKPAESSSPPNPDGDGVPKPADSPTLKCHPQGYEILEKDKMFDTVLNDPKIKKGKFGGRTVGVYEVMGRAARLNFEPVGLYGSDSSPRRAIEMIHKHTGLKYIHLFGDRESYDGAEIMVNTIIPPGTVTDELVSALSNFIGGDLCVSASMEDMHMRNMSDQILEAMGWYLRDVTYRGSLLGYTTKLDFCGKNTKNRSYQVMDRIFQFISHIVYHKDGSQDEKHKFPPTNVYFRGEEKGESHEEVLDTAAKYATAEVIYRKISATDAIFSTINSILNKGTVYEGTDPHTVSGPLRHITSLMSGELVIQGGLGIYNPLNLTLYLSGATGLEEVLGGQKNFAVQYLMNTQEYLNYHSGVTINGGMAARYGAEAKRHKVTYEQIESAKKEPRVANVSVKEVLPYFFMSRYKKLPPTKDLTPQGDGLRNAAAISIMYVFNDHFVGKSLIHGLLFKMTFTNIFAFDSPHMDALISDLRDRKVAYNTEWILNEVTFSAHYEYNRPFLLFTYSDRLEDERKALNDIKGQAHELALVFDEVLNSTETEFYKSFTDLDESPDALKEMMSKAVDAIYRKPDQDDKKTVGNEEVMFLRTLAELESLGYDNFCNMDNEIESIAAEIVKKYKGSVSEYIKSLLFHPKDAQKDITLYPIAIVDIDNKETIDEALQSTKMFLSMVTDIFLPQLWKDK